MIRTILSLLAALILAPDGVAQIGIEDPKALKRGAERRRLGIGQQSQHASGGCPYTVTQVDILAAVTGTGFNERIQVMTPCNYNAAGPDLPLIVAWNGFGLSAASFFNGMSDIPDEANTRGWLVVSVTGLDDKGFGAPKPQQNVEAAIDYMLANYPVDEDKIYGIGWSAGGGAITAFCARHLDPAGPMFAAVANNAGTFDLVDTYNNDTSPGMTTQTIMENAALFAGPPSGATLWNYLSSESLDHDVNLLTENEPLSQMRNLLNVPIFHVYSTDDTIAYLIDQNQVFAAYLTANGADLTSQSFSGLTTPHDWSLLDATATLDFFAAQTIDREPISFEVNADRDGTWYWAGIVQDTANTFTEIECSVDGANNHLDISGAVNLDQVTLSPPSTEFDPNVNCTIDFETADTGLTVMKIQGVTDAPTYLLDFHTLYPAINVTHDDINDVLTVDLYGPAAHEFEIRYDDYSASLTGSASVNPPDCANFSIQGSNANQPYIFLIGFAQGVVDLALIDANEDRNVLVDLAVPPVFVFGALDGAGQDTVDVFIPANLSGTKLRTQVVTYPGAPTLLDEISLRHDVTIN